MFLSNLEIIVGTKWRITHLIKGMVVSTLDNNEIKPAEGAIVQISLKVFQVFPKMDVKS